MSTTENKPKEESILYAFIFDKQYLISPLSKTPFHISNFLSFLLFGLQLDIIISFIQSPSISTKAFALGDSNGKEEYFSFPSQALFVLKKSVKFLVTNLFDISS